MYSGARGLGFFVNKFLFVIVEVVVETKFDERIWLRNPEERDRRHVLLGNIYATTSSKHSAKKMQESFDDLGCYMLQGFKNRGKAVVLGD